MTTAVESFTFEITPTTMGDFIVLVNGVELTREDGNTRFFSTRSSARKAITREKRRLGVGR